MRDVRPTPWLPILVATCCVLLTLVSAACGGGAGTRVMTPTDASGQPIRPGQPLDAPQTGATLPRPPRGVLAGRVLAFESGAPVARARVILSASGETPDGTPLLPFPRVLLTAADGTFRFTDLPATDTFLLTVTKTGFAPRAFGEAPPAITPTLITLAEDQVKEDVVRLSAQVSIAGRVLDEDGTPFAGALVEAMRPMSEGERLSLVTVSEASSDDRGEFRLVGLPPGQYYVSAFDPAFGNIDDKDGQLFYSPTFYPGVVFPDEATRITLDPGLASEPLEFRLQIIRPSRVQGSIRTPIEAGGGSKPLIAAAVIMSQARNDQFSLFTMTNPKMEPDGQFLFSNVPPGRYRIQARGETEREGVTLFSVFTLNVEGADRQNTDMTLSRGAVVSGKVEWESASGRPPLDRRSLIVRMPMEDGNEFGDSVSAYVGPDDKWTIRGVMAGRHFFRMEGLPEGWYMKRVEYQGADVTDIPRQFEYNEVVSGFTVVLSDRQTAIRGFVTADANDDVQSYAVVAFSTSPLHWTPLSRYTQLVYPDAMGRYEIRGLPAGTYVMAATREFNRSDLSDARIFDRLLAQPGVTTAFELKESQVWRQDVQPVRRRSGTSR
ncbi:MAG: carboxypeptidase regulatory-like domain-containing protein [Acidimicrobiia bacterium]|nr:carboxypeptidase regulatory-like domain-containing protein [Acidimicrobiia bacterium]